MALNKYILNGREMLKLDQLGMVDYDEYYNIVSKSYERRSEITKKYTDIQESTLIDNEPSINLSILYSQFLDEIKEVNPESYGKKLNLFNNFLKELNEEENILKEEKKQLLENGYPFDEKLRKHGYYIVKIDDEYFQYKFISGSKVKIDMGKNVFPQNAIISGYEFVPLSNEELEQIKREVLNKNSSSRKPR